MSPVAVHGVTDAANRCIDRVIRDDAFLLQAAVHEQAIAHRLAAYLQEDLCDYTVDVEYNRHGIAVKTAKLPAGVKLVVPDVVVHSRGNDGANILVIEVKIRGKGDAEDRAHAHQKLDAMVHGDEFRYELGLYVEFGFDERHGATADHVQWYVRQETCMAGAPE